MKRSDVFLGCTFHKTFQYDCHACLITTVAHIAELLPEPVKKVGKNDG